MKKSKETDAMMRSTRTGDKITGMLEIYPRKCGLSIKAQGEGV